MTTTENRSLTFTLHTRTFDPDKVVDGDYGPDLKESSEEITFDSTGELLAYVNDESFIHVSVSPVTRASVNWRTWLTDNGAADNYTGVVTERSLFVPFTPATYPDPAAVVRGDRVAVDDAVWFLACYVSEYWREFTDFDADKFDALAVWVASGNDIDVERFNDVYEGLWENFEEFARNLADDVVLAEVDDESPLARYFDYAAFARDLLLSGDYSTLYSENGSDMVHVFDNRA